MSELVLADGPSPLRIPFLNIKVPTLLRLINFPEGFKGHYVRGQTRKHEPENCEYCASKVKIQEMYYAHAQIWRVIGPPTESTDHDAIQKTRERAYQASRSTLQFTAWCHAELLKPNGGALGAPVKPLPVQGKWFNRLLSIPALDVEQFLGDDYILGRVLRVFRYRDGTRLAMGFTYDLLPDGVNDVTPLPKAIPPIAALNMHFNDRVPVSVDLPEPDPAIAPEELHRIELRERLSEAVAAEDYALAAQLKELISKEAVDAEQRALAQAHAPKGGAQ